MGLVTIVLIYVDDRERSSVRKYLDNMDADIQIVHLAVGDYQISDDCAFEHKTISDFLSSQIGSTKLKVLRQCRDMRASFKRSELLISGTLPELLSARNIAPNAIFAMLTNIIWADVGVRFLTNEEITANYIYETAKKEQGESDNRAFSPHGKRSHMSQNEQIFYTLCSVNDVGPTQAKNLLEHFGTIREIANSDIDKIMNVPLVGVKTAEAICRNLQGEYK